MAMFRSHYRGSGYASAFGGYHPGTYGFQPMYGPPQRPSNDQMIGQFQGAPELPSGMETFPTPRFDPPQQQYQSYPSQRYGPPPQIQRRPSRPLQPPPSRPQRPYDPIAATNAYNQAYQQQGGVRPGVQQADPRGSVTPGYEPPADGGPYPMPWNAPSGYAGQPSQQRPYDPIAATNAYNQPGLLPWRPERLPPDQPMPYYPPQGDPRGGINPGFEQPTDGPYPMPWDGPGGYEGPPPQIPYPGWQPGMTNMDPRTGQPWEPGWNNGPDRGDAPPGQRPQMRLPWGPQQLPPDQTMPYYPPQQGPTAGIDHGWAQPYFGPESAPQQPFDPIASTNIINREQWPAQPPIRFAPNQFAPPQPYDPIAATGPPAAFTAFGRYQPPTPPQMLPEDQPDWYRQ